MGAAVRGEPTAGCEIFLQFVRFERRRHDDELEVGPLRFLQMQARGEGDVAVEMTLVKFVEENRGDAAQFRVLEQLAQQNALGDEADARLCGEILFRIESGIRLLRLMNCRVRSRPGAASKRAAIRRGWRMTTSPIAEQTMVEQDLRNLGGLAGTGGRLENESWLFA